MVATTQDNPLQQLMRRIGYSVGLEDLVSRISVLAEHYAETGSLSYAGFEELVVKRFGRKKEAVEHFCNLYRSLGFVFLSGRVLHPLPNLEVLSILRRWFEGNDGAFAEAVKLVLTHAILEADGEIFLNALGARFSSQKFKDLLEECIFAKRTQIAKVVRSKPLQQKIFEIIDVKTFGKGKAEGSSATETSPYRFARRSTGLSKDSRRSTSLSGGDLQTRIVITDRYLHHVPKNRASWALDLGYIADGALTPRGNALLSAVDKLKLRRPEGCYVFWPYDSDLALLRIDPRDVAPTVARSWDVLTALATCVYGTTLSDSKDLDKSTIETLRKIYVMYRQGSRGHGSIRHQVPLFVAAPSLVGVTVGEGRDLIDIERLIQRESTRTYRRMNRVIIRGTEGGLQFPEET